MLDFKAICDQTETAEPQEIIEFSVLKVNSSTMETEAIFHSYVHAANGPPNTDAILHRVNWNNTRHGKRAAVAFGSPRHVMTRQNLKDNVNVCFVMCRDLSLEPMLPGQCEHLKIDVLPYFKKWVNLKKAFTCITHIKVVSMVNMLSKQGLTHTRWASARHH